MTGLLITYLSKVDQRQATEGCGAVAEMKGQAWSWQQSLFMPSCCDQVKVWPKAVAGVKENLGKSTSADKNLAHVGGSFCFSGQQRQLLTAHGREQKSGGGNIISL